MLNMRMYFIKLDPCSVIKDIAIITAISVAIIKRNLYIENSYRIYTM